MALELTGLKKNMMKLRETVDALNRRALDATEKGEQLDAHLSDIGSQLGEHISDIEFAATLGNSSQR